MRCHFVKGFSLAEFHRLVSMAVLPVIYPDFRIPPTHSIKDQHISKIHL